MYEKTMSVIASIYDLPDREPITLPLLGRIVTLTKFMEQMTVISPFIYNSHSGGQLWIEATDED